MVHNAFVFITRRGRKKTWKQTNNNTKVQTKTEQDRVNIKKRLLKKTGKTLKETKQNKHAFHIREWL